MKLSKEEKKFLKIILELEKANINSDGSFTVSLLEDFSDYESQQIRDLISSLKQKKIFDFVGNNLSTYTLHISEEIRDVLNKK